MFRVLSLKLFSSLLILCFTVFSAINVSAQTSRPAENTSTGFFIKDGKLYDANGNLFVPRGVNNGHVWFDHPGQNFVAREALDNIANVGFNSVRVVWGINRYDGGPESNDQTLREVIERIIELDMVPMVHLYDFTGGTNPSDVDTMARWWAARADLFNQYEGEIIINIANEWGRSSAVSNEVFRDAYKSAITTIRNSGIKSTLIIDANQWAQDFDPIQIYGREIFDHDPQKNIGFSVHYYCEVGPDTVTVDSEMDWARDNNLYLLVGEFAHEHADYGRGGVCDIKEDDIMRIAQENGQGYFWWAWNDSGDRGVNFSVGNSWESNDRSSLTEMGKKVVYDSANGVRETGRVATIFTNATPTPTPTPTPIIEDGVLPSIARFSNAWTGRYFHAPAEGNVNVQSKDGVDEWWTQQWEIEQVQDNIYRLKNRWSGTYLTAGSADEWTAVRLRAVNVDWWSQQWVVESAQDNKVRFKNRWTGLYLHTQNENNSEVFQAPLTEAWNSQQYYMESVE